MPVPHLSGKGGIILFDGICNLCNSFVQWLIAHDPGSRFRFGALQSVASERLLAEHGQNHQPRTSGQFGLDTVLYVRQGKVLTRSTAVLHIAKDLGGPWSVLYGFILVPRFLRDAVYNRVANHRYSWFGKRNSCMLPTPEIRARFIDA